MIGKNKAQDMGRQIVVMRGALAGLFTSKCDAKMHFAFVNKPARSPLAQQHLSFFSREKMQLKYTKLRKEA
jgi:hypothetical protein